MAFNASETAVFLTCCWQAVLRQVQPESVDAPPSWLDLYETGDRDYHALGHVAMATRCAALLTALYAPDQSAPVLFACFFHDAVYDARALDNEERSAGVAVETLRALRVREDIVQRTAELVLATKTHAQTDDLGIAILCDADLEILGATPGEYDEYAYAIRQEYAWVPDEAYRVGRIAVLKHFLARPRIYQMPLMTAHEQSARENLSREIEMLRGFGEVTA